MSRLTFTAGNHSYWLTDPATGKKQRVASVTTLLNQAAKPQLVKWAARAAAEYAGDHWDDLAGMPLSERVRRITTGPDLARDKAAARGTQIHAWAEDLLAGRPVEVPDEHTATVTGLARWWEASGWTAARSEAQVWDVEDPDCGFCGYAGTADLIATDRDGRLVLADFKTGAGVWPDAAVQVAAYAAATNLVTGLGEDTVMPLIDRLCVLHVRPDGTTLHEVDPDQRRIAVERFETLRALRWIGLPALTQKETA